MKGYKNIFPILMVVIVAISCYMLYNNKMSVLNEYNDYLSQARKLAEQGIVVDALEQYQKALGIKDDIDLNVEVGNMYVKVGDTKAATLWGEELIGKFPKEPGAYEFLFEVYKNNEDLNECFKLYEKAEKRAAVSDKFAEMLSDIYYSYYIELNGYEDVGVYGQGLCPVKIKGKWGYIDDDGSKKIPQQYKSAGIFIGDIAPVVDKNDTAMFIDLKGNKKIDLKSVGKVTDLVGKASDLFAANNGKTWSYYDVNCKKVFGGYEDATAMGNGIAAVKKDGYWFLIDSKGQKQSENKYSDIVRDEKDIVYRNGVCFVNIDGYYYLVNAKGEKIVKTKFINACLFNDDTYAAVKTSKGWTFIDTKGKEVFKNTYFENARSFSNGLAAVQKNGKWGFINNEGKIVIECIFKEVKDFNVGGCVLVKENSDGWNLLKLYNKNFES